VPLPATNFHAVFVSVRSTDSALLHLPHDLPARISVYSLCFNFPPLIYDHLDVFNAPLHAYLYLPIFAAWTFGLPFWLSLAVGCGSSLPLQSLLFTMPLLAPVARCLSCSRFLYICWLIFFGIFIYCI
jgi:hypothetical protein